MGKNDLKKDEHRGRGVRVNFSEMFLNRFITSCCGGDIVKGKELQFVQQSLDFSGLKNGNVSNPPSGNKVRIRCFGVGANVERRGVYRSGLLDDNGTDSNASSTEHACDVTAVVFPIGRQEQINRNGPRGVSVAFRCHQ
jgi:hypothetical protein